MVDHDALVAAFAEYSTVLLHPYRIGDVLYRLTDSAIDVLGVDGAGVSIAQADDILGFVAATSAWVTVIEAKQEAGGKGPCHDAYRTGDQIVVADLKGETRWPSYCEVAMGQGCRAAAGLPMPTHVRRIGALNLYRLQPHQWTDDELAVGQVLANMAAGYILNHNELAESRTVVDQLQGALDSRVVIEQAKGVVAGQRSIGPDEAFEQLRHQARSNGIRLHDLCRQVVDATHDPIRADVAGRVPA